jgi:hypothetical protein
MLASETKTIKFIIGSSGGSGVDFVAVHPMSGVRFTIPGITDLTDNPFPSLVTARTNAGLLEIKEKFCKFIDAVIEADAESEEYKFEERVKREVAERVRRSLSEKSLFERIFG